MKKILILTFIISFSLLLVIFIQPNNSSNVDKPIDNPSVVEPKTEEEEKKINQEKYKKELSTFDYYKKINQDYIGELYFDSDLVHVSIVQGETNDTYLRTDWQTMKYNSAGSVFIDYRNDIKEDQNIIIYGHDVASYKDPTHSTYFSPLRFLTNQNNYQDNKYINFFLGNELRIYEIVYVYRVKTEVKDGNHYIAYGQPNYTFQSYNQEEFVDFINKIEKNVYYETGVSIDFSDKFISLQTCIENSIDKLVILAKEIEVKPL